MGIKFGFLSPYAPNVFLRDCSRTLTGDVITHAGIADYLEIVGKLGISLTGNATRLADMDEYEIYFYSPSVLPGSDDTVELGNSVMRWKNIYVSGNVDGVDISAHAHTGGANDAPKVKGIDPSVLQVGSATTDASGNAAITFPTPFSATPKIFIASHDASARGVILEITSKSSTGFSVRARYYHDSLTTSAGSHSHTTFGGNPTASSGDYATNKSIRNQADTGDCMYVAEGPAGISGVYTSTVGNHSHQTYGVDGIFSFDWLAIRI